MHPRSKFSTSAFIRRNKINAQGQVPVYFRISIDGYPPVELSTRHYLEPDKWSPEGGKAKGTTEKARTINQTLQTLELKVHQHYNDLLARGKLITPLALKSMILGVSEKKHRLLALFEEHVREIEQRIGVDYARGTYTNFVATLKHLKEFIPHQYKTQDIALEELTYKFICDFEHYLKTVANNQQNGMLKHIQRLRKVIRIALHNDWLEKDPFAKFQARKEKTSRGYLTQEELEAIEAKEFPVTRLRVIRDLFLFVCYTGLAYGDLKALTADNLQRGVDGEYWIITSRKKTGVPSNIPLLPPALAILEKYRQHPQAVSQGKLFPVPSNQRLNSYLKEIADLCGIHKELSCHLGRHTFATTVTLSNNVPIETVSRMLGHTDLKTTQIYAKVVEKKVSEDMKALRDKLAGNQPVR
jgi:integrase